MNKPDVLGLKDAYVAWRGYSLHVRQVVKEAITENIAKAQRDADVAYYEPLIQQARQETDAISYTQGVLDGERKVTNEIFEKIEKTYGLNHYDDEGKAELYVIQIIRADAWQSLKDEYPKNKSL